MKMDVKMKKRNTNFILKILSVLTISLSLHANEGSSNPAKSPQQKEVEEFKKLIASQTETIKSCEFIKDGAAEAISKQAIKIKDYAEVKSDDVLKVFVPIIAVNKSAIKGKAICENVAEEKSDSKSNVAASCRRKNIYEFAVNDSNCDKVIDFLNVKRSKFPKKETFSSFKSKKIKETDSTCIAEGSITIDYEPCVNFANALALWKTGQMVVDQGQQAWMMGETQTAAAEAQGKADDPKAALGAMKTSAEAQSSVIKQKAAMESAKLAHLVNLYKKIPDADSLKEIGAEALAEPSYGILLNSEVKDEFKGELVKTFGTAAAQMIMAKIADDRVSAIGNAMAKVDAFQPVDFNVAQEDALVGYCQQNPDDPKCLSGSLNYNVDPFSGESIQFGNSATGTSYSNVFAEDNGKSNATTPSSSKSNNTLGPVGTTINGINKDNDIIDKSGVASVGDLVNPAGGGGGASAPGGGGGGGGGSPSGQKQADSVTAAGTSSKVSYTGGGGVSVLGNGLGIASRRGAKDDENPFGDLLGKNKGNANGVLNLRGPASVGKKDGNIFEQISSRYREVSSSKERLLEYQQVP